MKREASPRIEYLDLGEKDRGTLCPDNAPRLMQLSRWE